MSGPRFLHELLSRQASAHPRRLAVTDPRAEATYEALDARANRIAHALQGLGVSKGDRVGIWREKSVDTIAAMQAVLRLGAAYVPLDPLSPAPRIRAIVEDCSMAALIASNERAVRVLTGPLEKIPNLDVETMSSDSDAPVAVEPSSEDDLAYILYTSGSTGTPKGVAISHRNALAFVCWAASELQATADDRFANHAPFHFDLSVLDVYAAFLAGASVHVIPDGASFVPRVLVDFVQSRRVTIWYSVPTVLTMMMDTGGLLALESCPIRAFCFAGEPFPIAHLRRLFERWPHPAARYLNLYGPTETNVCTFHEVRGIDPARDRPVPIGRACSGDRVWAETREGRVAGVGEEGELLVTGPTRMIGYWGKPPLGDAPYRTGDLVLRVDEEGTYEYLGRLDSMVKVRGHRIELGDVEATLGQHESVHEAAVIVAGHGASARLVAFVVPKAGREAPRLLDVKRHCAERLPRYMIVDDVVALPALPRTRNGKVDRSELAQTADSSHAPGAPVEGLPPR
ncbi:MAG TPA: amino acid adenylation domain-containing protein [Polyangiaceae bacterium]